MKRVIDVSTFSSAPDPVVEVHRPSRPMTNLLALRALRIVAKVQLGELSGYPDIKNEEIKAACGKDWICYVDHMPGRSLRVGGWALTEEGWRVLAEQGADE